jgi:DNA-binding CsgD family transcriptional regulator
MSGIHLWRGFLHLRRGELLEAEEMLRASFESHDRWGYGPVAHQYTGGFFCSTMVGRGDLRAARMGLERGADNGAVSDGSRWWLEAKAELLLAEERFEEALAVCLEIERRFPHWNYPPGSMARGFQALALHALGRAEEARSLAETDLTLARAASAPGGLGRALRVLGTVSPDGEGFAHLWEAVDVLDGSTAQLEHARALFALGAALRREGVLEEARAHLTRALELAEVISAGSVAALARDELVASGVSPSVSRPSGLRALTETQRRLAALAAEGLGEHEIAQAMFVTPRAVDYQLGDVYRKLGVSSRDELALALTRD